MNLWECDHPGCRSTATGVGGAAGLVAIGWYFEPGPRLLCPHHHPETIACCEKGENYGKPCNLCRAERQANSWQERINADHGWPGKERRP